MAAVLAVSSYPQRTSPVLRGKWILDAMLGTPPPPPPPNVPRCRSRQASAPQTVRERLAEHRANAVCASCHSRIDPLGFALENYDVLGRWRTEEAGRPIDNEGELPDGTKFHGPDELKAVLLARKDLFLRNLTNKMLGYALGRGLTLADSCTVDAILAELAKNDYRAHTLIDAIVLSTPFRYQAGLQSKQKEGHRAAMTVRSTKESPAARCCAVPASAWPCLGWRRWHPPRPAAPGRAHGGALHAERRESAHVDPRRSGARLPAFAHSEPLATQRQNPGAEQPVERRGQHRRRPLRQGIKHPDLHHDQQDSGRRSEHARHFDGPVGGAADGQPDAAAVARTGIEPESTGVDTNVGYTRVYGCAHRVEQPHDAAGARDQSAVRLGAAVPGGQPAGHPAKPRCAAARPRAGRGETTARPVGTADGVRIDEYLSIVPFARSSGWSAPATAGRKRSGSRARAVDSVPRPAETPKDHAEHVRLMLDMIALAFQTDTTRIATFMFGNAVSSVNFRFLEGVTDSHHEISHHSNDPDKLKQYHLINRWHVEQYAYLLRRLGAMQEGERTVLDNSMVLFGSALSDGNKHDPHKLPMVLGGRGGGTLATGQHLVYGDDTPLANCTCRCWTRSARRWSVSRTAPGRCRACWRRAQLLCSANPIAQRRIPSSRVAHSRPTASFKKRCARFCIRQSKHLDIRRLS